MAEEKQVEHVTVVDKHGKHKHMVMIEPDELVRDQVGGFVNFLQDYAVLALSMGFIIGSQANGVVKSLVDTFLNPVVELIFGTNLSGRVAIAHHGEQVVKIPWGGFVYSLVQLFFVLIALYIIIKAFHLDRFNGKKVKKAKK